MVKTHKSRLIARTTKIANLGRQHKWEQALAVWCEMRRNGEAPDAVLFGALVGAVAKRACWERALGLFAEIRAFSLKPNPSAYGAAITACGRAFQWEIAIRLLHLMPRPDAVAVAAAIDACGRGRAWDSALRLLDTAHHSCMKLDVSVSNAALSACSRIAQWQEAIRHLFQMSSSKLEPDVVTFGTAIAACERGSRWPCSLLLLSNMMSSECEPNVVCYTAAISACEKGFAWEAALLLFRSMPGRQSGFGATVLPNAATMGATIASFSACSQWERALHLQIEMHYHSFAVDIASHSALIDACKLSARWTDALRLHHSSFIVADQDAVTCGLVAQACEIATEAIPTMCLHHQLLNILLQATSSCTRKRESEDFAEQASAFAMLRVSDYGPAAASLAINRVFLRTVYEPVIRKLTMLKSRSTLAKRHTIDDSFLAAATDLGSLTTRDTLDADPKMDATCKAATATVQKLLDMLPFTAGPRPGARTLQVWLHFSDLNSSPQNGDRWNVHAGTFLIGFDGHGVELVASS